MLLLVISSNVGGGGGSCTEPSQDQDNAISILPPRFRVNRYPEIHHTVPHEGSEHTSV